MIAGSDHTSEELLKEFGNFKVLHIKVKLEKIKLADLSQEFQLPDALQSLIGTQEGNRIEAKVIYDQFEVDLMTEESAGVKRLFQIICPIIEILIDGRTLICDELEASLHESVIYQIVQIFHHCQYDKLQLI